MLLLILAIRRKGLERKAFLFISFVALCYSTEAASLSNYLPDIQHGDIFNTIKNASTGTIAMLPHLIPSPKDVLYGGKQILAGLPFEVGSSLINEICSIALATDVLKPRITPDIEKMNFMLITPNGNHSYPLMKAKDMWNSPHFQKNRKTVIFVTGWTTDLDDDIETINVVAEAYHCRGDSNFVVLDSAKFLDTLYSWSAFNTEEIGKSVAKGLVELLDHVQLEHIHLIGNSLGAHIVGFAGRYFTYQTEKLIPRITGLDPARPCFNEGQTLSGLQRGDASFIDIIHSNPGVLGKPEPIGDVDFYPNGLNPLPPGCLTIVCAHERGWRYFAESVRPGNEHHFMGTRCNSLSNFQQGRCPGKAYPMGYAVPQNIKGSYFLEVNSKSPFGKGRASVNGHECNSAY